MIRLTTVGTGTVTPHPARTSAAHVVELPGIGNRESGIGFSMLMDCGAGTCHRLAKLGIAWRDFTHIAITHYHADHIGELPALIFAMKYGAMTHRSAPLTIIGPPGFRAKLAAFAAAFGDWVTAPGFPLEIVEIAPSFPDTQHPTPGTVQLVTGVTLTACKTPHTDESMAYSIATKDARVVYTGDTGSSDMLGDWARGCDLLLSECSLPDHMAMAIHLTPASVGALAARAQAKRLVLTHLYPPVETEDIAGIVGRLYGGPTVVARDGDQFEIG